MNSFFEANYMFRNNMKIVIVVDIGILIGQKFKKGCR